MDLNINLCDCEANQFFNKYRTQIENAFLKDPKKTYRRLTDTKTTTRKSITGRRTTLKQSSLGDESKQKLKVKSKQGLVKDAFKSGREKTSISKSPIYESTTKSQDPSDKTLPVQESDTFTHSNLVKDEFSDSTIKPKSWKSKLDSENEARLRKKKKDAATISSNQSTRSTINSVQSVSSRRYNKANATGFSKKTPQFKSDVKHLDSFTSIDFNKANIQKRNISRTPKHAKSKNKEVLEEKLDAISDDEVSAEIVDGLYSYDADTDVSSSDWSTNRKMKVLKRKRIQKAQDMEEKQEVPARRERKEKHVSERQKQYRETDVSEEKEQYTEPDESEAGKRYEKKEVSKRNEQYEESDVFEKEQYEKRAQYQEKDGPIEGSKYHKEKDAPIEGSKYHKEKDAPIEGSKYHKEKDLLFKESIHHKERVVPIEESELYKETDLPFEKSTHHKEPGTIRTFRKRSTRIEKLAKIKKIIKQKLGNVPNWDTSSLSSDNSLDYYEKKYAAELKEYEEALNKKISQLFDVQGEDSSSSDNISARGYFKMRDSQSEICIRTPQISLVDSEHPPDYSENFELEQLKAEQQEEWVSEIKQRALNYLESRKIDDLFHYLGTQLVAANPPDPITFLIKLLDTCMLYRAGFCSAPLIFQRQHVESLYDSMDILKEGYISLEQYHTGMLTFGIKFYDMNPVTVIHNKVSKNFFVEEI